MIVVLLGLVGRVRMLGQLLPLPELIGLALRIIEVNAEWMLHRVQGRLLGWPLWRLRDTSALSVEVCNGGLYVLWIAKAFKSRGWLELQLLN